MWALDEAMLGWDVSANERMLEACEQVWKHGRRSEWLVTVEEELVASHLQREELTATRKLREDNNLCSIKHVQQHIF